MKKQFNKFLSFTLSIVILIGTMLPFTISAENNREVIRTNLISAWQTISAESKHVVETLAVPRTSFTDAAGNNHSRIAVTADTKVAGAGLSSTAVLGDYYAEYVKFSTTGSAMGWSYVPTMVPVKDNIKLTEYDTVYMYAAAFDANKVQVNYAAFGVQLNNGNSGELNGEFYSPYWKKFTFKVTADSIGTPKIIFNHGTITYVSFGSIIGEGDVTGPALPENHDDMTLLDLVTIAKETDYKGFASSSLFESALADALDATSPEAIAFDNLVAVWNEISKESKIQKETLAVPNEQFNDIDGNPHSRIAVTEDTKVAGAGLSDVSVLGDYYAEYVKFSNTGSAVGWSYTPTMVATRNDIKLTDYNTVYMYLAAFDANKKQSDYAALVVQLNNGNSGEVNGEFYSANWKKFTFNVTADSIGNPKIVFNHGAITYVSFGSIIGEKTVFGPKLPMDYNNMSLPALVEEAKEIDYKGYPSSEAFVKALEEAQGILDSYKQEILDVWQTLAGESKHIVETLASSGDNFKDVDGNVHPQIAVTEDTKVAGNNLGDVSRLGDYYAEFVKFSNTGNGLGWSFTPYFTSGKSNVKLTEYDKVYMYVAAFDANKTQAPSGSVYVQLNNGNSGDGTAHFYSANWKILEFNIKADSIGNIKIMCSGNNITYLSFGSIIGEKTVYGPAIPENFEEMNLIELVKYTRQVDCEGFYSTEAFKTAIDKATKLMQSEIIKYDLITAWQNLSENNAIVKEVIALPATSSRQKVDESTSLDGLTNNDLLGGYYVEKYKWSDTGSAMGWAYPISHSRLTDGYNFSEYESVYFYLSAYDADGNASNVNIVTQTNNTYADDAAGTGWIKIPYSRENVDITGLKFVCTSGTLTYVSYGAVIGERKLKPKALPENYEEMTLEEIVDFAVEVEADGFANGDVFQNELNKAKAHIGTVDINLDAKNGNIAGIPQTTYYGDKITLSATADNGYKFRGWYKDGQKISDDIDYSFAAQKINDIKAKFVAIKGDVNLDNTVDSLDLAGLKKALLKGDYTEHAYINEDDVVDTRDLVRMKKNFVEKLPDSYYLTSDSEALIGNNKEITEFKLLTNNPSTFNLVEFSLQVPNLPDDVNVYKESDLDITMTLTNADGEDTVVDAFYFVEYEINEDRRLMAFSAGEDSFRIRVKPNTSGTHSFNVTLAVKGEIIDELSGYINVEDSDKGSDLLMVEPNRKQNFVTASGEDYVAIGENIAWNMPVAKTYEFGKYITEQMDILVDNGGNHVRIWDSYYSGGRIRAKVNEMSQSASAMWDYIFESAEDLGLYITFTLLNHGEISQSNTDNHFNSSCWHANNGGYITDANLFFTDANTKAALKTYIRYIVSRWGYSENLMTWEICNEIDHGIGNNSTATVTAWLNEMAAYLREQDPYDHMISNSPGKMDSPFAGLKTFDFIYYHMYNYETSQRLVADNVQNAIAFQKAKQKLYNRPVLFGEWGVAGDYRETVGGSITEDLTIVHHGNWIGVMGGGAGTGQSWYWDELNAVDGQKEYRVISQVAKQIPWNDANMTMIETSSGVTVSNSQIKASGYKGADYAYVWFYDKNYLAANRTETTFNNATGTVDIGNGTYNVRWINTWTGECVREETITVENGKLPYTMPKWTKDVLLTVTVD